MVKHLNFYQPKRHFRLSATLCRILLCLAILAGALPTAVSAPAVQAAEPADVADGTVVAQAASASALDAAPPADQAIAVDPNNPAWITRYGSLAGRMTLAPRHPTFETITAGPDVPIGAWSSSTLEAGVKAITSIAAAPDGRLFAGVDGDGLWIYAPDANGVYSWTSIKAGANSLASNGVTALAIFGNELWVGTSNAGISVLNLGTNSWTTINSSNSLLPSNVINRLTVVHPTGSPADDYLWAATGAGAARYSKPPGGNFSWAVFNTSNGLAGNDVFDVAVWFFFNTTFTFFATDSGLTRYNGSAMTQIFGGDTCLFKRATRVIVDAQNNVWMAVQNEVPAVAAASAPNAAAPQTPGATQASVWVPLGVCRYTNSLFSSKWEKFDTLTPGLPSTDISDMSVDGAGRVWMSFRPTNANPAGGAAYDQGAWLILKKPTAPLLTSNINRVLAVGEAVWFGHTDASAFSIYSPNWQYFNSAALGNNGVPGALLVEQNRTWAGVGSGLARYESSSWNFRTIPGNSAAVTSFVRGSDGLLWIGTAGSGLFSYDGASGFTHQTTADGLPSDDIRGLLSDQDGRLWVATANGLALRGNGYWLAFTPSNSGIASADLRGLTTDATGRIWVATAANGISILDTNANGGGAWSAQTTVNGLPADVVNALTTDPSGAVWAATSGGVGRWDPATNTWSLYKSANGLPGDNALSIAADPAGLIWVGTANGLALLQGSEAQPYHVTGSFLGADRVRAVAADTKQVWASAGALVAVRGIVTGPIGDFPPTITAITPSSGAPLSKVIITGTNFDNRGPLYNKVTFCCVDGQAGIPAPVAKVISVTTTSMAVEVPLLAKTGKILVTSHQLNVQSATDFEIVPVITSLSENCVGYGTLLEIHGRGFFGVGSAGAYVTIGNGPERLADAQDPTLIRQYIRPGDTTGVVKVRLLNNQTATSSPGITVVPPALTATTIQQGVQGEQMIWGKRTLVQVFLRHTYPNYCKVKIDKGQLEWKKKDGTLQAGGRALFAAPEGLMVGNPPPTISLSSGVNFIAEFDSYRSSYYSHRFPLNQFNGVHITLKNGLIDVLSVDIPASSFNFEEINDLRTVLNVPVVPPSYTKAQFDTFWGIYFKGIDQVARVYPQPDIEPTWLRRYIGWPLEFSSVFLGDSDDNDDNDPDDNFGDVKDAVDDIREDLNDHRCDGGDADDPCRPWLDQGMGIIASELYVGGYSGKATISCFFLVPDNCDMNSAVSFNFDDGLAPIWLQEAIHATGWIDDDSPNHDDGNSSHSLYDEGEWNDVKDCNTSLTFRQALVDQTGGVKRVIRLDEGDPYEFSMPTAKTDACRRALQPRSVMSYVPNANNGNTFLEPLDYRHTLNYIRENGLAVQQAQAALSTVDQTLRFNGRIDAGDRVTVTLSAILGTEGAQLSVAGGDYHLLLRDGGGQTLLDHTFTIAAAHTHSDAHEEVDGRFNLRVPFPTGTKQVEIQHNGQTLLTRTISANAPTVSFTAPNGGTFNAATPIPLTWTASDADGDPLQFNLDYSPDDGQNWQPVAHKLTGLSYNWTAGFVPASQTARLRLRASDGFNTAEAVSAPFILTAQPPMAFIHAPTPGQIVTEGSLIDLIGGSLSGNGVDQAAFEWRKGSTIISTTRGISYTVDTVGVHTFDLVVTADGLSASKSVSVTVVADYDRDGLPNAWEQGYSLNPIDAGDSVTDADSDGLSNYDEYKRGTNPRLADTDGDTANDGAEVTVGTDPLTADQAPTGPILQVGATNLGYTILPGGSAPAPHKIWVTNSGVGDLNWSATSDAAWLVATPSQGAAPTEMSITAQTDALAVGTYTGHITVTAGGATNSPRTITVTLKILGDTGQGGNIYLPMISR